MKIRVILRNVEKQGLRDGRWIERDEIKLESVKSSLNYDGCGNSSQNCPDRWVLGGEVKGGLQGGITGGIMTS